MTAAERKKIVQALHGKLVKFLTPLGIEVEHVLGKDALSVAEFTFRVRAKLPDGTPGKSSELVIHLAGHDVQLCHNDPKHLDQMPILWARILADWVPDLFKDAELPTADEVDWRPTETIPEDFGAA